MVSIKFRNKFSCERIVDFRFEFDELNEITRCLAEATLVGLCIHQGSSYTYLRFHPCKHRCAGTE